MRRSRVLLGSLILFFALVPFSFAAVYVCPQPDGTDLYTDKEAVGCRPTQLEPLTPSVARPPGRLPAAPVPTTPAPKMPAARPKVEMAPPLSHRPFDSVTVQFPALNYYGGRGSNSYVPKAGEVMHEEITIGYLASGKGPRLTSLAQLDRSASRGLRQAVLSASAAVGYDPAYLDIYYDPISDLKEITKQLPDDVYFPIAGDSASAIQAVAIAATLLGDQLRTDICMTGSIQPDTSIGFVGKVDHKIYGCAKARYREMVIPLGQKDISLTGTALTLGLTITEVANFAEAYEVVTGNALRVLAR